MKELMTEQEMQSIKDNSEIYNQLNSYVIGQETATKNIVSSIYEHIIKCKINQDKNKKDKLDKTLETIAQKAIDNNTGSRGLRNTLSNVLNKVLFDASIDKREEYTLTPEVFY